MALPGRRLLPYGGLWRGHDGVRAFSAAHDEAEEILGFETTDMIASGDRVAVLGTFEGRAKPDGQVWRTEFVHVLTVRDEHLQRWEAYFDSAAAVHAHEVRPG